MSLFRKKPVAVEAFRLIVGARMEEWPDWARYAMQDNVLKPGPTEDSMLVVTNHGPVVAEKGSWIIRSPEGELYPATDAVFQATYEAVTGNAKGHALVGRMIDCWQTRLIGAQTIGVDEVQALCNLARRGIGRPEPVSIWVLHNAGKNDCPKPELQKLGDFARAQGIVIWTDVEGAAEVRNAKDGKLLAKGRCGTWLIQTPDGWRFTSMSGA